MHNIFFLQARYFLLDFQMENFIALLDERKAAGVTAQKLLSLGVTWMAMLRGETGVML